jgi:hypothetical protein
MSGFLRGYQTNALVTALMGIPAGETVPYELLNTVVGGDIRGKCRTYLNTARKILVRDHAISFLTIPKVGLRRLADGEVAMRSINGVDKVHRTAMRERAKLKVQNVQALSTVESQTMLACGSLLSMVSALTQPKEVRRFTEGQAVNSQSALEASLAKFK